jgi:hypothetical protein
VLALGAERGKRPNLIIVAPIAGLGLYKIAHKCKTPHPKRATEVKRGQYRPVAVTY